MGLVMEHKGRGGCRVMIIYSGRVTGDDMMIETAERHGGSAC